MTTTEPQIFKYQADLSNLADCPPGSYKPAHFSSAYRFVFESIDDSRNFEPVAKLKPDRFDKKADGERCEALALSFYNAENAARAAYRYFLSGNKHQYKTLGTHLAEGFIAESDGVNSPPDRYGHFNHHPYTSADFAARFRIIESLL